ncbi:MAG TPA: hypothetical protein VFE58_08425 [Tepidisphaeraceae bacterium]|jgi:hypothetical protein|nr:hypothetical protein [Tepidisphaeraceae bacterium]
MAEQSNVTFAPRATCPACRLDHAVKPQLAGKRVKCRCGHLFQLPQLEKMLEAASLSAAEIALARGYMPARKKIAIEEKHPDSGQNFLLDLALPILLVPAGVWLCIVQAMYYGKQPQTFAQVVGDTSLGIVASLVLMIGVVIGAGLWMSMAFTGPRWQIPLKICAVALIPAAAGAIVGHKVGGINGDILSVFVALGVYVGLVKLILRLGWDHTCVIVFACWTIRAITMYVFFKYEIPVP